MPDGLEITLKNPKWKELLPDYEKLCRQAVETVIDLESCSVSILLTDNDFIHQLNRTYRQVDRPTNVLSFPMPELDVPMRPMGDIVLALETIVKEAQEQGKSLQAHFTHLLIHGSLHLCGYDHIKDDEAEQMEKMEIERVMALGFDNPYQGDRG